MAVIRMLGVYCCCLFRAAQRSVHVHGNREVGCHAHTSTRSPTVVWTPKCVQLHILVALYIALVKCWGWPAVSSDLMKQRFYWSLGGLLFRLPKVRLRESCVWCRRNICFCVTDFHRWYLKWSNYTERQDDCMRSIECLISTAEGHPSVHSSNTHRCIWCLVLTLMEMIKKN